MLITVKSRYNGSQGTNEFYALLPDCVIAIMTIPDYLIAILCGHFVAFKKKWKQPFVLQSNVKHFENAKFL